MRAAGGVPPPAGWQLPAQPVRHTPRPGLHTHHTASLAAPSRSVAPIQVVNRRMRHWEGPVEGVVQFERLVAAGRA